jgi:hypothetical protein
VSTETIANLYWLSITGAHTSLVLDASGNPHIAFGLTSLEYASWNGSSWSIQTVDENVGRLTEYVSLALDASGNSHIAYCDESSNALKYAVWDGSSWSTQTVDSAFGWSSIEHASLALDSNGNAHISYSGGGELRYASFVPEPSTLALLGSIGATSLIAFGWRRVRRAGMKRELR